MSTGIGSPKSAADYYGRKIIDAQFNGDRILLTFSDGITIKICDDGQSCCEHRYMTCDGDNIEDLIGHILTKIEVKDAPSIPMEYGDDHDQVFLEIQAGHETITIANHNEHNGYYGGIDLSLDEVEL